MNIKPLYLYGTLAVVIIILLILFTTFNTQKTSDTGKSMPPDSVNKQLSTKPPDKNNVAPQFYQELERLRTDVEKHPDDTLKLRAYADYLTAAHQFDSAIPPYKDILDKDPKRTDIYFALTYVYFNKKDFDKAEEMSAKVLTYDQNNLQAQYNIGAISATRGDKQKAREIWTKLYKNYPGTKEGGLAKQSLDKL